MVVQLRRQTKHNLRNVNGRCYRHHNILQGVGCNTRRRRRVVLEQNVPVVVEQVDVDNNNDADDVDEVAEARVFVATVASVADDVPVTAEELEYYFQHFDKITDKSQIQVPKRIMDAVKSTRSTSEILIDESLLNEYKRLIGICHFVHTRHLINKSKNLHTYGLYLQAITSGNYVQYADIQNEMRRILKMNKKINDHNTRICERLSKIRFAQSEAFRMKIAKK